MAGDTIFSLSTAQGRAGIAVIRVSGSSSKAAIEGLTQKPCSPPRQAALRRLACNGTHIDTGLVLYFPAPDSFTGEDMAEFQVHGGRAVILALSRALESLGCRQSEAGEFSKRAFLNNKIDLTEAEAIADLIDAETEAQHAQALLQADGGLSALYDDWARRLLKAQAYMEASLDFADEDLPEAILEPVYREVAVLATELKAHLADARRGERLREGMRIAVMGAPNAGKSSFINSLSQRDIAIVSPEAGTTRDVLEVHLDLGGYPVIIADTAGLRNTAHAVEREGVARALAWGDKADLRLWLFDGSLPDSDPDSGLSGGRNSGITDFAGLTIMTKSDLALHPDHRDYNGVRISTLTGDGIGDVLAILTARIAEFIGTVSRPIPTRERHASHIREALDACQRFPMAPGPDLAAEELRVAAASLGRITGRVDAEALLDVIFRDFCIGK